MSAQLVEVDLAAYREARRRTVDKARSRRHAEARRRGEDISMKPAEPVRVHLQAFKDLGWSMDAVAIMHGNVTAQALSLIRRGVTQHVEARVARIVDLPLTLAAHPDLPDGTKMPSLGVTRRIHALMRLGYPHAVLTAELGRCTKSFAFSNYHRTRAIDWRDVDELYDRLCGTPGPSNITRARAQALGYAPPLAWNDIDDPAEVPNGDRARDGVDPVVVHQVLAGIWPVQTTKAEKVEIVARWRQSGRSLRQLEQLTGWKTERYYDVPDVAPAPEPSTSTGLEDIPTPVLHAAAVTTAELALDHGWVDHLADVLDALGLRQAATS